MLTDAPAFPAGMTLPQFYAELGRQKVASLLSEGASLDDLRKLFGPTVLDASLAADVLEMAHRPSAPLRMEEEFVELSHFTLRWALHGHANFNVSDGLASSLLLTDCAKVPVADVKWPFPTFLVTLPYPQSLLHIASPTGALLPVRWILFHTMHMVPDHMPVPVREQFVREYSRLHRALGSMAPSKISAALQDLRQSVSLQPGTVVRLLADTGLSAFSRAPWPNDTSTIAPWIGGEDHEFFGEGMWSLTDIDRQATAAAGRLLVNLALYIALQTRQTSLDLSPRTDHFTRRNPITTYNLGTEVKLPKELREAAKAFALRGTNPTGWKLQLRQVVRGHWREQPKGLGRQQRERIWIQPYWRGPDSVTAVERVYSVGEPSKS